MASGTRTSNVEYVAPLGKLESATVHAGYGNRYGPMAGAHKKSFGFYRRGKNHYTNFVLRCI